MGRMQRDKGAVFERAISDYLRAWIAVLVGRVDPADAKRKLGQARDAGNDIDLGPEGHPLLVIECKRRKTLGTVYSWLKQARVAVEARGPAVPIPVVVAREDRGDSIVILSLDDFLGLIEPKTVAHYERYNRSVS